MRIRTLTLVQSMQIPLQAVEERGHTSVVTLLRNEPKRSEVEKSKTTVVPAVEDRED
jgi:hypothetical protein